MVPKKILLAEDDVDDQRLFHDFLQHRTDIVLMPVVENGVEVFETLEKIDRADELPDLIILDQNMPKSNGLQTLEALKHNTDYSAIPVAVYSTYTDAQLIESCIAAGACAVITKPLTKEGYNQMIEECLQYVSKISYKPK
ncbi:MAG TPA: response regulator [Flavisolibacter sp.]|nr:response regulator [Flavisolibacter sp.]